MFLPGKEKHACTVLYRLCFIDAEPPQPNPFFSFFIPLPSFKDSTVVSNGIYSGGRGIVVPGVAMVMVVVMMWGLLCVHTLTDGRRGGQARSAASNALFPRGALHAHNKP